MFDHAGFRQMATQLRDHGVDYEALGITSFDAANWANHGFLPDEAQPWIRAEFNPCTASAWANRYIGVAEAVRRRNFGESGRITSQPCKACTPVVAEYTDTETAYGQTVRHQRALRVF